MTLAELTKIDDIIWEECEKIYDQLSETIKNRIAEAVPGVEVLPAWKGPYAIRSGPKSVDVGRVDPTIIQRHMVMPLVIIQEKNDGPSD
jgi:hypothetical protein